MYAWLLASLAVVCSLLYTTIQVSLVALRNYKAHKFFSTHAPELPVVPDKPNLFTGHSTSIILRNDNIQTIAKLHEQLGPTFGYYFCEQPWVSTKDLDLIKLIELTESHKHINRAPLGVPVGYFKHSIFQVNDSAWRRMRAVIAPALTNRIVRSEATTSDIESVIEQLAAGLKSRLVRSGSGRGSMILNAGDMFQRYTLAVIFLITYQRERIVNFLAPKDGWVSRIDSAARQFLNPLIVVSLALPFVRPLLEALVKLHPVGRMDEEIIAHIKRAVHLNEAATRQQRLQLNNNNKLTDDGHKQQGAGYKRRLVDTAIDALFEKRIRYDEFIGTLQFLLLAGLETTADTISSLIWQLARHQEIQEQLRESIRREGLDSQYLEWCVKETIRFHPAAPLGAGRVLGADVQFNGLCLPKGTFVMPSTHTIHHDPRVWPEPEQFKPERWQRAADFHPAAFMGFGLGARNCVGGKLAMHEIKLVIKLMLANYRIERCPETPDEYAFSSPVMIYTLTDSPIKVRLVELV